MDIVVNKQYKAKEKNQDAFNKCIKNLEQMAQQGEINWAPMFLGAIIVGSTLVFSKVLTRETDMTAALKVYVPFLLSVLLLYAVVIQFLGKMPYVKKLVHIMEFPFLIENKGTMLIIEKDGEKVFPETFRVNIKSYQNDFDIVYFLMDKNRKICPIGESHINGKGKFKSKISLKDIDTACKKIFSMGVVEMLKWNQVVEVYVGFQDKEDGKNTIYGNLFYKIPFGLERI